MVVAESPFAALQLVGIMLPVVVLTLRAYTAMFDKSRRRDMLYPPSKHIKRAYVAVILSLLFFISSAIFVLVGLFVEGTFLEVYILPAWAISISLAFLMYFGLIMIWYQKVAEMGRIELV